MNRTLVTIGTTLVVLAAVFCLIPGCEKDADTGGDALDDYFKNNPYVNDPRVSPSDVKITPASATVTYVGERVYFEATGGAGSYSWDATSTTNGGVAPQTGPNTIYTAASPGPNNVIVYDKNGDGAIAYISSGFGTLAVSPAVSAISSNNATVVLQASGGRTPYAWSMQNGADPYTLNPAVGSMTVVQKNAAPPFSYGGQIVVIQLTDADGQQVFASVTLQ
ncbi:hypothetical protein ACFLQU_04875 [Verrucomicrobiota bacterium]